MARVSRHALLAGAVAAALLLVLLPVLAPAPLNRDPPRDLPWQLPDYRLASARWTVAEDGTIHASVEHFFLQDITPQMVSWFYRILPVATIDYRGRTYPLYHIFHPTEHGRLSVLEAAADGRPGMGSGALVRREEWFGPYDSRGSARIADFSAEGMVAVPEVFGMRIGEVRHSLAASDGGTVYRVDAVIGSDLPVLGPLLNLYLRTRVFHPAMMEQWQRHQIEEVASLQFFLAYLYSQGSERRHFTLDGVPGAAVAGRGPRDSGSAGAR